MDDKTIDKIYWKKNYFRYFYHLHVINLTLVISKDFYILAEEMETKHFDLNVLQSSEGKFDLNE